MYWINVSDQLPRDRQLVLAYIPDNWVSVPGAPTEKEHHPIKMLRFELNFYGAHKPRHKNSLSDHFWSGEGLSNHFFQEVTHWMELPQKPNNQ